MSRHGVLHDGNRFVSLAAAIVAVLAALGTLLAHHRSISALAAKNDAILTQARASDTYGSYEAMRIRVELGRSLYDAGIPKTAAARAATAATIDKEQTALQTVRQKAENLQQRSEGDDLHSQSILKSYETLEIATTFFEIAIIFVSISAVTNRRLILASGLALTAAGCAFFVVGLLQHG